MPGASGWTVASSGLSLASRAATVSGPWSSTSGESEQQPAGRRDGRGAQRADRRRVARPLPGGRAGEAVGRRPRARASSAGRRGRIAATARARGARPPAGSATARRAARPGRRATRRAVRADRPGRPARPPRAAAGRPWCAAPRTARCRAWWGVERCGRGGAGSALDTGRQRAAVDLHPDGFLGRRRAQRASARLLPQARFPRAQPAGELRVGHCQQAAELPGRGVGDVEDRGLGVVAQQPVGVGDGVAGIGERGRHRAGHERPAIPGERGVARARTVGERRSSPAERRGARFRGPGRRRPPARAAAAPRSRSRSGVWRTWARWRGNSSSPASPAARGSRRPARHPGRRGGTPRDPRARPGARSRRPFGTASGWPRRRTAPSDRARA